MAGRGQEGESDWADPEFPSRQMSCPGSKEKIENIELAHKVSISSIDDAEGHRHGTLATASSHIVTAIIGAGVLGLPQTVAWLGWIAGICLIVAFYLVTLLTSTLLASVYEVNGVRHRKYPDAVKAILGRQGEIALTTFQTINMVLSAIAFTIAAGQSGRAVVDDLTCDKYLYNADCTSKLWWSMLPYGGIQLLFSQLPDLGSTWWVSAFGAAMSIGYSVLALGMCISKGEWPHVMLSSNMHGTITGISTTPVDKVFQIFNALGTVAFAYNFATVLVEIQDTLKEPPKAKVTMVKAINTSVGTSFLFYLGVSITGYMAFGNAVPDGTLTAHGIGPTWTVTWANVMVFIHMISAYQVFSQPIFASAEPLLRRRFPNSVGRLNQRVLSIIFRSIYVGFTTLISCIMPFFSQIVGLVGALVFWPAAVLFPILMYTRVYPVHGWRRTGLWTINGAMAVVALLAVIGSVRGIILNASTYKIFS